MGVDCYIFVGRAIVLFGMNSSKIKLSDEIMDFVMMDSYQEQVDIVFPLSTEQARYVSRDDGEYITKNSVAIMITSEDVFLAINQYETFLTNSGVESQFVTDVIQRLRTLANRSPKQIKAGQVAYKFYS
jgi:hypothetical protein